MSVSSVAPILEVLTQHPFPLHSVPLCFVYPAMLHLKAVAETRRQILVDWLMIIFGSGASIFTTVQTIKVRTVFHPRTHRMLPDDLLSVDGCVW